MHAFWFLALAVPPSFSQEITFEGAYQLRPAGGTIASVADGPPDPWFGSYPYHYLDGWNHAPRVPIAWYEDYWEEGGYAAAGTYVDGWDSLDSSDPGRYAFSYQGYEFDSNYYYDESEGYVSGDPEYGHEDRRYTPMPGEGIWEIIDLTDGSSVAHGTLGTLSLDIFYDPDDADTDDWDPWINGGAALILEDDGGDLYAEVSSECAEPELHFNFFSGNPPPQAMNWGIAPLDEQWAVFDGTLAFGECLQLALPDADGDGYDEGDDCDDADADVHPHADETCDGVDQDCNDEVDDDAIDATTWYSDEDGDGFGGVTSTVDSCDQPEGYVSADLALDCDDNDPSINPDASEVWYDGVDQKCDGNDDDQDGDGFPLDEDCDDTDAATYPGAEEIWYDGVDQSCDGNDDDQDGDGYPLDNDCDDGDAQVYPGAHGWSDLCERLDDAPEDDDCGCVGSGSLPTMLWCLLASTLLAALRRSTSSWAGG